MSRARGAPARLAHGVRRRLPWTVPGRCRAVARGIRFCLPVARGIGRCASPETHATRYHATAAVQSAPWALACRPKPTAVGAGAARSLRDGPDGRVRWGRAQCALGAGPVGDRSRPRRSGSGPAGRATAPPSPSLLLPLPSTSPPPLSLPLPSPLLPPSLPPSRHEFGRLKARVCGGASRRKPLTARVCPPLGQAARHCSVLLGVRMRAPRGQRLGLLRLFLEEQD